MFLNNRARQQLTFNALWIISGLFLSVPQAYGQALPQPTGTVTRQASAQKSFTPVIWHDPGTTDLLGGPAGEVGAPSPPFTFIEENLKGSNPKIKVKDANGLEWSVKWGTEVNAETFATRLVAAVGYFAEPAYFVPSGKIEGVTGLTRAKSKVKEDGSFVDARFELKGEKGVKKLEEEESWSWADNPFVGKRELNGLKIMVMLVSNWDNKDVRDVKRGSNTAIFQTKGEARYVVTDWGGSMGKWGGFISREKWDCGGFTGQTRNFIKGVKNGMVEFGYSGQHSKDFWSDIKVQDVQWLIQYLDRITDDQLKAGLASAGATPEDQVCFTKALRERIVQLRNVK
jgi:hypothetical protein